MRLKFGLQELCCRDLNVLLGCELLYHNHVSPQFLVDSILPLHVPLDALLVELLFHLKSNHSNVQPSPDQVTNHPA